MDSRSISHRVAAALERDRVESPRGWKPIGSSRGLACRYETDSRAHDAWHFSFFRGEIDTFFSLSLALFSETFTWAGARVRTRFRGRRVARPRPIRADVAFQNATNKNEIVAPHFREWHECVARFDIFVEIEDPGEGIGCRWRRMYWIWISFAPLNAFFFHLRSFFLISKVYKFLVQFSF